MKINWFSPLPPARTEIANYTARILPTLRKLAEITLWTDQIEYDPRLKNDAEVRFFQPGHIPWSALNRADVSIYHIGNNPLFHGSIWQISLYHPGIVVLHDLRLQHFFAGLYKGEYKDREGYIAHMKRYYGEEGCRAAESFWYGNCSTEYMAEHYPLTSLALENVLGVLVHSSEAFDILRKENRWPLVYLPLPFPTTLTAEGSQLRTAKSKEGDEPYRLIVFGYLGPNRQLDTILKALSDFPGKEKFRLDIYGQLWKNESLAHQIKSLKLEGKVVVHGFVPEEELDAALSAAHLAINLRYPTMGEASASQLRIWDHSLPSLVTRTGWYATLSEEVVAFVDPESPIKGIQSHLDAFLTHPARFLKMGENGRRKLEMEHQPSTYAEAMIDFILDVKRFRPEALAYRLAERVGAEISFWMDPIKTDEPIKKAAKEIYLLTSRKTTSKAF